MGATADRYYAQLRGEKKPAKLSPKRNGKPKSLNYDFDDEPGSAMEHLLRKQPGMS